MRYWGFLVAKLLVVAFLIRAVWLAIAMGFGRPAIFLGKELTPFTHDLGYTAVMMLFFTFCAGLLYVTIWDQRYRCRTCLRRLRRPVSTGSWPNMLLFGQPRTEYICLYGHGTLKVPDVQLTGTTSDWQPHGDDIWKELESIEESKR